LLAVVFYLLAALCGQEWKEFVSQRIDVRSKGPRPT
jgi:hypothetical protein